MGTHRVCERPVRCIDQARRAGAGAADRDGDARVRVEPVELCGDVKLHEVAFTKPSSAGNAMDRLVIDADAGDAPEAVLKLRPGARARMPMASRLDLSIRLGGIHSAEFRVERTWRRPDQVVAAPVDLLSVRFRPSLGRYRGGRKRYDWGWGGRQIDSSHSTSSPASSK